MHSFFQLYLTINAPDFQLIPLDCNTNASLNTIKRQFFTQNF